MKLKYITWTVASCVALCSNTNELRTNHSRVIDLSKLSLTPSKIQDLWKNIEQNKRVNHIIWGDNTPTDPVSVMLKQKIEEKIIQNNKNYLKHPNDFIHALLSSYVYKNSEPGEKVEFKSDDKIKYNQYLTNWKVQKVYNKPEAGKYYAASFTNESEYQIVLAHRGTTATIEDIFKSDSPIRTDIIGILGKEIVAQLVQDYVVTKEVVAYAKENGYQLSITGHSLGAWLAEFSVYFCAADFFYPAKAVTFDSPGSIGIKRFSSNICNQDTEKNAGNLDIVTYLSSPNFVNTCNQHLGTSYRLFPKVKIPELLVKAFGLINVVKKVDIEPISSIFSHSLDPIIETFNPVTGKPEEYQQIKNWPVIEYTPKKQTGLNVVTQLFSKASKDNSNKEELDTKDRLNNLLKSCTLISILNLLGDILTGRIDQSQQLECWKYLKQISEGELPKFHITNPENEFGLKYNGRYDVDKVNLFKDRIDKPSLRYLKALANLREDFSCKNLLINKQLNVIRKQYVIKSDPDNTNPNKIIESNGDEDLTVEQLNNWLSILVAVDRELKFTLDNDNQGQRFSDAVTQSYQKLSNYANKISPDLVSKSSAAQNNEDTFDRVRNAIEDFKKLGAEDSIKDDYIANKITRDKVINCIRTMHSLSNHFMYKLHDGKAARDLLQSCKDIAENCIPYKEGSELYFNNLDPQSIYNILPKRDNQPEEIAILYTKIIYHLGRTYIYQKPGTRDDGKKYFKLAKYLGEKFDLLEGHLSVRSGLGIIKEDAIDASIKEGSYSVAQAKSKYLKAIELYEELKSNEKPLHDNPLAPQQKKVVPKDDPYNNIECNEQIVKYYGKLVSITPNPEEKVQYTREIIECTKCLFDKLQEVQNKKSASVFNTLGNALLKLNDANVEPSELMKLMQLVEQNVVNECKEKSYKKKSNLEIIYLLFADAYSKSLDRDYTKPDSANGMMKVLKKEIDASPKDKDKLKEIKKIKNIRDSLNKKIHREIEYGDIVLINNSQEDSQEEIYSVAYKPENYDYDV
ncbi:uncharacterized protein LOC105845903 [Hydra vulgaris]|uniref:uncharacterized protein LOC105845903 n=1 Tax=Hydra vulgaris TaxID=6087 RepID=UPI001F5EE36E|nr:uncharacterized protein LOC105845903 [Hydra vulgaris]XP_047140143.1 uncharacterized protein LOC105845903 [Hydra vulgaris]XP_047140144.1 uncharacterized protein LOC105845903 [Hydra vulgaris]XP_047140145.1 uncharacterized protein LOC105845903 [Hydra vulgaris]